MTTITLFLHLIITRLSPRKSNEDLPLCNPSKLLCDGLVKRYNASERPYLDYSDISCYRLIMQ